jgi:hypothetical protein
MITIKMRKQARAASPGRRNRQFETSETRTQANRQLDSCRLNSRSTDHFAIITSVS